ncbi:MAG: response regulator [Candidatus Edwardsbacteria bacterium]
MSYKVMVVDDELDIVEFVKLVLEEADYRVITAITGEEALRKAQIEKPNLILLDIMMPEMDGWEVLKILKIDENTSQIPVAMLTARTEAKDRLMALQEEAIDYICKPFSPKELIERVETIFAQVGKRPSKPRTSS